MKLNSSQSRRLINQSNPKNQSLQRQQSFREKFRSIDERHRDYTLMTRINGEISNLKEYPICSDCFKQETKSIFKALNFDKKDFLRDVKGLRQQFINLEKFKYP
jgi:hypothetical protein